MAQIQNLRMKEKVDSGDAIDISDRPKTAEGYYELDDFVEDKDYCVLKTWTWIWSIGISYQTGKIYASTSADLYLNDGYECLWLR